MRVCVPDARSYHGRRAPFPCRRGASPSTGRQQSPLQRRGAQFPSAADEPSARRLRHRLWRTPADIGRGIRTSATIFNISAKSNMRYIVHTSSWSSLIAWKRVLCAIGLRVVAKVRVVASWRVERRIEGVNRARESIIRLGGVGRGLYIRLGRSV